MVGLLVLREFSALEPKQRELCIQAVGQAWSLFQLPGEPDESDINKRCTEIPDVDEECLDRRFQQGPDSLGTQRGLWLPLVNDCRSWANRVLDKCRRKCLKPELAIDYPGLTDRRQWQGMGAK